jgi:predicted NBD/HSP70 family sugar kinase
VTFAEDGTIVRVDGAHRQHGARLAIATPGLVADNKVVAASNLGWFDVDPAEVLGIGPSAALVLNDAEAAALGELALRDATDDLMYVSLGTGVGGAVVIDGVITGSNLFGHASGHSDMACVCGRVGCLETVAGGWALPAPLSANDVNVVARAVSAAIEREPLATPELVVIGGGLARRYPHLVDAIEESLPHRVVEPSAAPQGFKSASAWGLRAALTRDPIEA